MGNDITSAEAKDNIRGTLSDHIERLSARLATEPDAMQRQILQARIDNMVLAQKKIKALQTAPGHA